ncbi:gliding motility lipoprotein GldK [Flavobacteriaceae bacterium Ap0902]|nr:gliding motility lipoprotein GldK [Flavobacteriaceae bacterium Ap0902]
MRKILAAVLVGSVLFSCGGGGSKKNDRGMIIPEKSGKNISPTRPVGMVAVPGGSFVMGNTDYDFAQQQNATPKTVSVGGFYIDDSEITNAEYKVFVNYVRDSIVRQRLAERAYELGFDGTQGGDPGIGEFAFKNMSDNNGDPSAYQEYINEMADGRSGYESERQLNWDRDIIWDKNDYPDRDYVEVMESMYYPPEERFNGERLLDVRKLNYVFSEIDKSKAARAHLDENTNRSDFVITDTVNVYPDTTVWVRDFNYAYNDPLHEDYFWNEAYNEYPVVGVTWDQARAFCAYRTNKHRAYNQGRKSKNREDVIVYRLPTEVEWEYAARGGIQDAPYPWGGPYLADDRGCYLANFKPKRGDYVEDCCAKSKEKGFMYAAPVKTFYPNDYGLYDMAGNVAEWTQSPYHTSANEFTSTLNPTLGAGREIPNKVVKGGSWKDVGFMLMVGVRDWAHQDSARSYIGFRTVQTIPEGADVKYKRTRQ